MTFEAPLETTVLASALRLLLEATQCARDLNLSGHEFALEVGTLRRDGISDSVIRWLCHEGYIRHVVERTRPRERRRHYQETDSLAFFLHFR